MTRTWAGTNSGSWSDPANWGDTALGPGGITKSGWSRLTLSAMNTYSGATLVSQDYLEVNGSSPAIPITVSSTATTGGVWGTGTTGPIVVTAGSRNPDGTPVIPLNVLDAQHVAFELPAGAQPGPVSVMALNPPFTPYTSSGTDPGGAPTLPCERPEEDGNEGWQKCDA